MWQDDPVYVHVFVAILRDIFKEETVEYVLALSDEMLAAGTWKLFGFLLYFHLTWTYLLAISFVANPKRARLFRDKSLSGEDTYEPCLR